MYACALCFFPHFFLDFPLNHQLDASHRFVPFFVHDAADDSLLG